jgi:hypothetical protein
MQHQLGFSATDFDTDLCALTSAASQAQLHLNQNRVTHITIFATNPAAIKAITNLCPHPGQSFSRDFCTMLTQTLSVFRNTRITIEWCLSEVSIAGIHCCIDLARNATTAPFPPDHRKAPYA